MKKMKWLCIVAAVVIALVTVGVLLFGEKIKMIYISLRSFQDENLAHTFQHTPEIQPVKKIAKGEKVFQFQKGEEIILPQKSLWKIRRRLPCW